MKRIALLTLLAFSATHVAFAAPNDSMKQVRKNAMASKAKAAANRAPKQQARRMAQPQVQRSKPNLAAQQAARRIAQPQIQRSRPNLAAQQARARTINRQVVKPTPRVNPNAGNIARQNAQNQIARQNSLNQRQRQGNNNNNRSGNWRNNNNSGSKYNWANRGENWRRRHGNWNRNHHNRSWWRSNFTRFALFGGGYYYWNSGYWYPAYGYDPYFNSYTYDAPIYGYNNQDPGQVIANVQVELQRRGYSPGGVDGAYGPMTRNALIRYQSDNGLPATGEIDEETLAALGLR